MHQENAWGYLILLYILLQLSRVVVVGSLYPFLCYFGYGLDWKEAIVLVWSGLRGAVSLSLSLSVKQSSDTSAYINRETGILFVFFTGGIVFLTLIVNGSTTQFVLQMLEMNNLSAAKRRMLHFTKCQMVIKAQQVFRDVGDDEELGPAAEWPTIKKYFTCLNDADEEHIHPYTSESDNFVEQMHLSDMRIRLLNSVQAAYQEMLVDGRIKQSSANILMQSVDGALDLVLVAPLSDWNELKASVYFPNYYKFLQTSWFPQKLVTYLMVERLEFACSVSAAFLRAHRIARQNLHEFIGDSEIALAIINESVKEGEEAKSFLEDIRLTFPEVLHVVKTRQVGRSVLHHLFEYVQDLKKAGLLGKMELVHLHDAVQNDSKKLGRNLPLVNIQNAHDLISANPLLGALPSAVREQIVSCSKETMKLQGVALYREGSKPNGIWLISKGMVKCNSKTNNEKFSLSPTFSHGSTLGLYEVLTGKSYVYDVITDSVVLCFFIEAKKILSLFGTDDVVANLLWQESSIVLSKMLIPQVFEKMSMHQVRTFVAESSTTRMYMAGETFEVHDNTIGLLLEGLLKTLGSLEHISAPAALFPSHGRSYVVETRGRVMMFNI
ncbi:hypothetical protein QVD17_05304 [Tagetes erecta]|uniref:Cyclic nucleotide-binding domain-containing protein n=1 Tax=Tagetes erecta TaxID=13708 RepID=A0AAD8P5B8_TARER|nr:hypothetical protein QVD17_05304 [Tagetes erecta]